MPIAKNRDMQKKILIITPKFPIPTTGACEQERIAGFLQLKHLGFEIRIIAKYFDWQSKDAIERWSRENNIKVDLIEYSKSKSFTQKIAKLLNPINWDGAAFEYKMQDTQNRVQEVIQDFQPSLAWFDYTYLWPLYHLFKDKKIPIITRSINFEPIHFLEEDGMSLINLFKFLPKLFSELKIIKQSNYIFAITPKEEKLYRKLGAKNISTLPLRSLPSLLKQKREINDKDILHLFFMGASYNVHHNLKAAELVIKYIAPDLDRRSSGKFFVHILGKKLPEDLSALCRGNIKEEGFVENLGEFLRDKVDIAVIPSLMGAGMQQKIFEPLVYGIPSVVSERGIAGYPYKNGEHALFANTKEEFVDQIIKLRDFELRKKLSKNSLSLSLILFSKEKIDNILEEGLRNVL